MALSQQLRQALPQLMHRWVPFNAEVVSSLRSRFENCAEADLREEDILRDLKTDPSLFCWCLAGLSGAEVSPGSPVTLSGLLLERAREFCSLRAEEPALHRLADASLTQQRTLQQTLTRTTSSAILAPYFNADGDSAFAVTALREIGVSLISWNYPRIYEQALKSADNETLSDEQTKRSVDQYLLKMLGFTPLALTLAIAEGSSLPAEVQIGIGRSPESISDSPIIQASGLTLHKISEVSEIFAAAHAPGARASAIERWSAYSNDLRERIGSNALLLLQNASESVIRRYARQIPALAAHLGQPGPVKTRTAPSQRFRANLHISHCSNDLQDLLGALYGKIESNPAKYENIGELMREIAPLAGFCRGAVYFISNDQKRLEPVLTVGEDRSLFTPVYIRAESERENPVSSAFLGRSPVVESRIDNQGLALAGVLGIEQRVGVLYLQTPPPDGKPVKYNPRLHFKALQQALVDCLDLY